MGTHYSVKLRLPSLETQRILLTSIILRKFFRLFQVMAAAA